MNRGSFLGGPEHRGRRRCEGASSVFAAHHRGSLDTLLGDVLFRYMRARHRFRERVEHPLPAHELAALIGHGKVEFDEVYIEPDAKPPIVFDGKADDVFDAIINKKYHALPLWDPQVVAAWRHHVLSDGSMPRRPGPRRPRNSAPKDEPPTPPLAA
jgi:hypothetical protein